MPCVYQKTQGIFKFSIKFHAPVFSFFFRASFTLIIYLPIFRAAIITNTQAIKNNTPPIGVIAPNTLI